jgi:NAD-dependent dihydropyrimidine dehydrogenase PreA subunit
VAENTGECRQPAGAFRPQIDRSRCEGKAACVAVCPYDVFTLGVLPVEQRRGLSLRGKLKGFGHGWKQAFAERAEACRACAKCVDACPEEAIRLVRAK